MSAQLPLMPGTVVRYVGDTLEIVAVGWVGERYYWLKDKHGAIAMLPGDLVESLPTEE